MKEKERERDGIEGRKNRRRSFEELRPSAFASRDLAGCDLIMRMMFARTWTTNRDAIVGKLQDPKSRHSYFSSLRFQSTSSSLSCSCTRDSHVHIRFTNYTYAKNYTHERLYTQSKKKRNTIILYSRSAFCLQFHFNLLFVNLPSTLRKALHTCAQKKIQKNEKKKERRHHFC